MCTKIIYILLQKMFIYLQNCITAAKDWEKKLENLSRLWKVYSQKEQALVAWLQQAETVIKDNEDDTDSLIRKHKGFFNRIDKRLLDDYLRSGQDILMVLDDGDKAELQQDMASVQEKWKVGFIFRCMHVNTIYYYTIFLIFVLISWSFLSVMHVFVCDFFFLSVIIFRDFASWYDGWFIDIPSISLLENVLIAPSDSVFALSVDSNCDFYYIM